MSIILYQSNNHLKVVVEDLDNREDVIELLSILDSNDSIEINFLNIKSIPKEVILKLNEKKKNLKLFTNEAVLKQYLMNLGFELEFQNRYKGHKKFLNLEYIAIGGSSGSLKKFIEIVKNLPESNLSVFIVMHQKPDIKSTLSDILRSYTSYYNVVEAVSDTKIEPSTIYVAPPGKHLLVAGGFIFLSDEEKVNFAKPSISKTFETMSNEYKNSFLAILVCGYGADGSDTLEFLQKNESTVIIENPDECDAKPMLENAIKTKNYDYVLDLVEISNFIKKQLEEEFISDENLKKFLSKVHKTYGYDYSGYNFKHLKRRIELFYNVLNSKSFFEFEKNVLSDITIFKDLFLNLSVNVTTFYRNPEVFKVLKEKILPKLDSFLDIKIWCAGCSSGEEPYSIAIFLKELGLLHKSIIYATDINDIILRNAKNALYSTQSYNIFLKHYYQAGGNESFSSYFKKHNNFVELKEEIKEKVLFFRHNLSIDGKVNDFQLIFCRNVIIYFDNELKDRVFKLFQDSLDSYGFLVLGESESLDKSKVFDNIDKKNKIYKRKV